MFTPPQLEGAQGGLSRKRVTEPLEAPQVDAVGVTGAGELLFVAAELPALYEAAEVKWSAHPLDSSRRPTRSVAAPAKKPRRARTGLQACADLGMPGCG